MIEILIYIFLALSLSMDAFTLTISLGTMKPSKIVIIETALTIGLFHFFMPIIGYLFGSILLEKLTWMNLID